MGVYTYNPAAATMRSFADVEASAEWKNDSSRFVFRENGHLDGDDRVMHVITFNRVNELFSLMRVVLDIDIDKRYMGSAFLKLTVLDEDTDGYFEDKPLVMVFSNSGSGEPLDEPSEKYLQRFAGDGWKLFNEWRSYGFVFPKDREADPHLVDGLKGKGRIIPLPLKIEKRL